MIQSAFKRYRNAKIAKVRMLNRKREVAAVKIQLYYRYYKKLKNTTTVTEEVRQEAVQMQRKFLDYIITFKYLKPKFHTLIKQFKNLTEDKISEVKVSACVRIQYYVRRYLKKKEVKVVKVVKKKVKKRFPRPEWKSSFKQNNRRSTQDRLRIQQNLEKLRLASKKRA